MEYDDVHTYESIELRGSKLGGASADLSRKSTIKESLDEQHQFFESDNLKEQSYSDQQRQTIAHAQASASIDGGDLENGKSKKAASHVKKCLVTVALVAVVTVVIVAIAMSALAVFNNSFTHSTSQELTNKIDYLSNQMNQLRNESQTHLEEAMDLTEKVNYLSNQLSLARNKTQETERDLENKYQDREKNLLYKVNLVGNESLEIERSLIDKVNNLSSQLDLVRNKSQVAEQDLTYKVNMLRNESQETESDLINKVNLVRNESQETERDVKNRVDNLSNQLSVVRNESQEVKMDLTNKHQQLASTTWNNISQLVTDLNMLKSNLSLVQPHCGAGLWYRVAFLNMSDPSQQCPLAWRLVTTSGVRACGRPATSGSSCPAMFYSATSEYQRVCGRVIGYQDGSPDGFTVSQSTRTINNAYMDGVSITYGQQRNHIWSFVAGLSESSFAYYTNQLCPCLSTAGQGPEPFVGDNYYCESGNPNFGHESFYSSDKLWDGKQCDSEGTCCSGTKSPPWFSVRLSNPTNESIEVRICGNERTSNEDTPIELLEIFVQ